MALKPSYGIRTPMLSSSLDTEITLQKDGVGLRPLPIKFVIITIVSGCLCLKATTSEVVAVGNIVQKCIFVCLWITITILLFMTDKTKRFNFQNIISLISFLTIKSNREVVTRRSEPATGMLDICNIRDVSDDGLIKFADRTYGYMYRVIGTASVLLFEQDKKEIINNADNFYRKVATDSEYIFITLKEPQKVYNQAAAVKTRYSRLTIKDPDLQDLCNNQLVMLRDVVGKKYQSIHQYMILKADNVEALTKSKIMLQNELQNSGLYIRRCIPLNGPDILEALAPTYTDVSNLDSIDIMTRKHRGRLNKNGKEVRK